MRYLIGFVLFLLALGTLPMVGCGDEPAPEPCEYTSDCDDGDRCTSDYCQPEPRKYCTHSPISCRDTECKSSELDVCDPEAPPGELCGAVTIYEGRSCEGGGSCDYWECVPCDYYCMCGVNHVYGSYRCSSLGNCLCHGSTVGALEVQP